MILKSYVNYTYLLLGFDLIFYDIVVMYLVLNNTKKINFYKI